MTVVHSILNKVRTQTFITESLLYHFQSVVVTFFEEGLNGPVVSIKATAKLG